MILTTAASNELASSGIFFRLVRLSKDNEQLPFGLLKPWSVHHCPKRSHSILSTIALSGPSSAENAFDSSKSMTMLATWSRPHP
eukprot:537399-Alexandrium_andersonii.AAC.1